MGSRMSDPKKAMDYPRLKDDLIIIWTANEHEWPHAGRETYYMSDIEDRERGHAMFSPFFENARTFADKEEAHAFIRTMNARRPQPYQNLNVTTVAEMKLLRGYEMKARPEDQDPSEVLSL